MRFPCHGTICTHYLRKNIGCTDCFPASLVVKTTHKCPVNDYSLDKRKKIQHTEAGYTSVSLSYTSPLCPMWGDLRWASYRCRRKVYLSHLPPRRLILTLPWPYYSLSVYYKTLGKQRDTCSYCPIDRPG